MATGATTPPLPLTAAGVSGRETGAEVTPPAGGMAEEGGLPDAVRTIPENQEEVEAGEVIAAAGEVTARASRFTGTGGAANWTTWDRASPRRAPFRTYLSGISGPDTLGSVWFGGYIQHGIWPNPMRITKMNSSNVQGQAERVREQRWEHIHPTTDLK